MLTNNHRQRERKNILIVHPEPETRRLVAQALQNSGYQTWQAGDVNHAVEVVFSQAIDLLFTEIRTPWLSGFILSQLLQVYQPNLRVLAAAELLDERLRRDVLRRGFQLLAEPFTPAALVEKVHQTLDTAGPDRAMYEGMNFPLPEARLSPVV